ncbi:MAG TPA: cupin domain-containing protein [Candidatus Didemnitutus sp.]|nr:cupin domain-containing protein [Candidatus Didemnitutus sp.]
MEIIRARARGEQKGDSGWFTGEVWIEPIAATEMGNVRAARVSFAAGARTAWHTHPLGQMLQILSGVGRVQREGGGIFEVRPGDTVWFAPNERHWHGAAPTTPMAHLAMQLADASGQPVTWERHVTAQEYDPPSPAIPQPAETARVLPPANEGLPELTPEEKAADFQILEVEHVGDLDDWERTLKIGLPRFQGSAQGGFRVAVVRVLGDSDAVFRVWKDGRRAYVHLRWSTGSAYGYATFFGLPAWHPIGDPVDSPAIKNPESYVKAECLELNLQPLKFASRPSSR